MKPGRAKIHYYQRHFITKDEETSDEDNLFKNRRFIDEIAERSQPFTTSTTEDDEEEVNDFLLRCESGVQCKPLLVDVFTQTFIDSFLPSLPIPPQAWLINGQVSNEKQEFLKQFQIFKDITEATECSFIYALRQAGIPELKLIDMKTQLKSQKPQKLFDICKNANIHVVIRRYLRKPDGNISTVSKDLKVQKERISYSYIGAPAETASFNVRLVDIDGHYMIRPKQVYYIQKIIKMINKGKIIPYN